MFVFVGQNMFHLCS